MTATTSHPPGVQETSSPAGRTVLRICIWTDVFLVAIVVASAGWGLLLPHVGKEGWGAVTWLGAAMATAGTAVAALATWRLLSSMRRRWWTLAIPAMLVAGYLALWTVGQGVAASIPAHPALGARTPADVGLDYRDVTLRTADGVDLAAWWVPSRNRAAVALFHGAGSARTAVLDQAAVLAGNGYGVLLVDARGHGESDGRGMDFGWYGDRDARAAVDFLTSARGVDPDRVGLVGMSMGGEEAIGAAGVDPRVRAVVAEGATNRVAADKGYLVEAYGARGRIQQGIDWLTYGVADLLTDAPQPQSLRSSVAATTTDGSPTPVLLVTAGEIDTEAQAASYIQEAAPDEVDVWTVPDAGHTEGLSSDPVEWEQRVVGFLDAALL